MMETRLLLAIVAVAASILVFFNVGGAFYLQVPLQDASSTLSDRPPSPKVKLVSSPFPPVERTQGRSIVLVHVGKTGGETVRHTLRITCRMRKNPIQQKLCWDSFANKTESALSRSTIGTLHCALLLPEGSVERASTLLWTLRNPLDRVVSWFQYMNPANCRPLDDYQSTACNTNRSIAASAASAASRTHNESKKKGSKWAVKFFGCFPTIHQFADALGGDNNDNVPNNSNDSCSQMARRTIAGEASPSSGHIHFNHKHYWSATMADAYPKKEIWVLRTEYLWDDMIHVEQLLSMNNSTDEEVSSHHHWFHKRRNVTHGSEGHVQRDQLSSRGMERLCCALSDEIAVYMKLLELSTNLDALQRNQSLNYLLVQQCGNASVAIY